MLTVSPFPDTSRMPTGDRRWALIAEVDAAIRSVMASMGRDDRPAPGSRSIVAGGEVFGGRLLALRHAEGLATATREVRVGPGTVVTPLARDLLKRRGVAIRVVSGREVARVRRPGEWAFAIEREAGSGVVDALRRAWLEEDWLELEASLDDAALWVAADPDRGALVLADEASTVVWRACRLDGVRASGASEPEAVARAVRSLGMNLLVVEPSGKSIAWIRQLALTFRRGGAPAPPDGLGLDRAHEGGRR